MAYIKETKMSHSKDIKDIFTTEYIEVVENWKKEMKNRNKDYLIVTDFEFLKRYRLCQTLNF